MENQNFKKWLKRKGLSESTVSSYINTLRLYEQEGFSFSFDNACRWKELQMQNHKPGTVNIRIHAINKYAEYTKTRWRLKPVKVQNQQYVENQLTMTQYNKLLSCLYEDGNLRWWVSIKVLASTGVRISEFLQIRLEGKCFLFFMRKDICYPTLMVSSENGYTPLLRNISFQRNHCTLMNFEPSLQETYTKSVRI